MVGASGTDVGDETHGQPPEETIHREESRVEGVHPVGVGAGCVEKEEANKEEKEEGPEGPEGPEAARPIVAPKKNRSDGERGHAGESTDAERPRNAQHATKKPRRYDVVRCREVVGTVAWSSDTLCLLSLLFFDFCLLFAFLLLLSFAQASSRTR